MKKIFLIGVCLSLLLLAGCGKQEASAGKEASAAYPQKEITMICPWTAGGGTDSLLRALCRSAEKELGTTIAVSNITGSGGATGHAAIMKAKPDGYSLGMVTIELNSLPAEGLANFTYEDFEPLIRVNMDEAALTVRADAPYNTLAEFIAYAKAHPGEISIGTSARGSSWHMAAALMAQKTGIDVKYVPFEGAVPAVTALEAGHIQAVSVSAAEVRTQAESGRLKILGVMAEQRNPLFPNVRTFKEQGVDLVFGTWRGIALPKGVKPEVKKVLTDAFTKAMQDPEFVDFAQKNGLTLAYQNSSQFAEFLAENAALVDKTMEQIGLKKK